MTIAVVRVTDRNFRITIPEEIRLLENINQGDYIQIDVVKMDFKGNSTDLMRELNENIKGLPNEIAKAIQTAAGRNNDRSEQHEL